jgi:NADH dehydrogenase (ubiquinone) flavoprotein 2
MSAGMAAADGFEFTAENRRRVDAIIARYPEGRQQSAVLPLLDLAQRQCGGWLPRAAIEHVAAVLGMARMRVEEVVSFYTMFFDKPVGQHVVWVCTTTPCWLRGSDAILNRCRKTLGIEVGETSADGAFTLLEAECLGACVNAPMAQINDDYYEDLDPDSIQRVLDALKRGEAPKPGSQAGRRSSEPAGGPTTLKQG